MAAIGSSLNQPENQEPSRYKQFQVYYNPPLRVDMTVRSYMRDFNGRKYPDHQTWMVLAIMDRSSGTTVRNTISMGIEDWYRWIITIGELLSKVKTIYIDNRISDEVSESDFKITTFKNEVVQMVPLVVKQEGEFVNAVRIILNDESRFADFPLIDIKNMYNVLKNIDVYTAGLSAAALGALLQ